MLEEARIATSHDDIPHIKPVSFVFDGKAIIVATDYHTRTFDNIKANPQTSIVIDIYKPKQHKAVCIVLDKMFRTLCVYDAGQNTWLVFLEITQIGCFVRPLKKHSRDISSK